MVKKYLDSINFIAAGAVFSLGLLAVILSPSYLKTAGAISGPISGPIATPTPSSGNSGNSSFSGADAPKCDSQKPGGAPRLLKAEATGSNQVTLTWSRAADPVTYYTVVYGYSANQINFGNPNVGGKNTLSYVVKGLGGNVTYFFKVRAGNDCMPGDYSNAIPVRVSGKTIASPAVGFKQDVLSAKASSESAKKTVKVEAVKSAPINFNFGSFIARILNLFHLAS